MNGLCAPKSLRTHFCRRGQADLNSSAHTRGQIKCALLFWKSRGYIPVFLCVINTFLKSPAFLSMG